MNLFSSYGTSTFDFFKAQGIDGPKPIPYVGNAWGIWKKSIHVSMFLSFLYVFERICFDLEFAEIRRGTGETVRQSVWIFRRPICM